MFHSKLVGRIAQPVTHQNDAFGQAYRTELEHHLPPKTI